jgi:hypothetical protein
MLLTLNWDAELRAQCKHSHAAGRGRKDKTGCICTLYGIEQRIKLINAEIAAGRARVTDCINADAVLLHAGLI